MTEEQDIIDMGDENIATDEAVDDVPPMMEQPSLESDEGMPEPANEGGYPAEDGGYPAEESYDGSAPLPGEGAISPEQEIQQLRREIGEIKQVMVYQAKQQQALMQGGGGNSGGGFGGLDPNTMAALAPLIQSIAPAILERFMAPKSVPMMDMPAPQPGPTQGFEALMMELMMKSLIGNIEMNQSINNLIKERVTRSIADDIYQPNDERRHRVVHQGKTDVERHLGDFHEH